MEGKYTYTEKMIYDLKYITQINEKIDTACLAVIIFKAI